MGLIDDESEARRLGRGWLRALSSVVITTEVRRGSGQILARIRAVGLAPLRD